MESISPIVWLIGIRDIGDIEFTLPLPPFNYQQFELHQSMPFYWNEGCKLMVRGCSHWWVEVGNGYFFKFKMVHHWCRDRQGEQVMICDVLHWALCLFLGEKDWVSLLNDVVWSTLNKHSFWPMDNFYFLFWIAVILAHSSNVPHHQSGGHRKRCVSQGSQSEK